MSASSRHAAAAVALDGLDDAQCALCAAPLERPDCPDGHGDACPDRVCTGCDLVVVVGPVPVDSVLDLRASA